MKYLKDIPEKPLFNHQKIAIQRYVEMNGIHAFFHDMGLGKTRTALNCFNIEKQKNPNKKLAVICFPSSLIESAWAEDVEEFSHFRFINMRKELKRAAKLRFKKDYDVYVINFEQINFKFTELCDLFRKHDFMAVLDESAKIKDHTSQTTKKVLNLRNFFKQKIIASATPAPNIELEYWAQMRFLKDDILDEKFSAYKAKYFHLSRGNQYQAIQGQLISRQDFRQKLSQGFKLDITSKNRDIILNMMKPYCHFVKKEDALDLPPQVSTYRIIEMKPKQRKYYNQMKNEMIVELGKEVITGEATLKKVMKLRQITSGFLMDDERIPHELDENPKLKELENIIEELPNEQLLIWCQFQFEVEKIKALLGDKAECYYGKTKEKDRYPIIRAFKEGRLKYLIAHPQSLGHGQTFINCRYMVFFSLSYSFEYYFQPSGRINRPGQTHKTTVIHLVCEDSIDENIVDVINMKNDKREFAAKVLGVDK